MSILHIGDDTGDDLWSYRNLALAIGSVEYWPKVVMAVKEQSGLIWDFPVFIYKLVNVNIQAEHTRIFKQYTHPQWLKNTQRIFENERTNKG